MGGVFNLVNLHLYHYAGNNPVKYIDPDGETPKTVLENHINSATNAIGFFYQKMEAIQKIGIGVAKLAMGIGVVALGVGVGGAGTLSSGGIAISESVAVAHEAIIAGGIYVGAGVADVLDGIVMMSQGNNDGAKWKRDNQNSQRSYNQNDKNDIRNALNKISKETGQKLNIGGKEADAIHQEIQKMKAEVNPPGSNQNLSVENLQLAIKNALNIEQ
jgi:hypothetical protein